jgi:hypothetical protein
MVSPREQIQYGLTTQRDGFFVRSRRCGCLRRRAEHAAMVAFTDCKDAGPAFSGDGS